MRFGKEILNTLKEKCVNSACSSMLLQTVGEKSKPVYLSQGFKIEAIIPDYKPGFRQYHMLCEL